MLRGLKRHTENICAVVSVADDGGGSGVLRDELGMPPPGDIRNCLEALANTEPTMQGLLTYRFKDGRLKGQCFGNLFLAALNGMCESFDEAVLRMSEVLAITGRVLPVSNDSVTLVARFDDGAVIRGESKIAAHKLRTGRAITRVTLSPESPGALPESLEAIEQAEMIVIGPGSLYTSLIPNFLTSGIAKAVAGSDALKIYVLNIMTQVGETDGYTAFDHVNALFEHSGEKLFDICLANSATMTNETIGRYNKEYAEPTVIDAAMLENAGVGLITAPLLSDGVLARHDPGKLSDELMRIFSENAQTRIYG
jgi:uncharacterized cofD-like protein